MKGGDSSVNKFDLFASFHRAGNRENHSVAKLSVWLQSCKLPEISRANVEDFWEGKTSRQHSHNDRKMGLGQMVHWNANGCHGINQKAGKRDSVNANCSTSTKVLALFP